MSWHPASIERMLKTDAGILRMLILRMLILRMLGKMLNFLPGLQCPGSWATKYVGQQSALLGG